MGFTTGGIAAEIAKFDRLASGIGPACENAVKAGGKVLAEALRDAAPEDTGALKKSMKASKVQFSPADGHYSEVGPGTAKHPKTGEPLAKIGNISFATLPTGAEAPAKPAPGTGGGRP